MLQRLAPGVRSPVMARDLERAKTMPSSHQILEQLTTAANAWQAVASGWHVLLFAFLLGLVCGWRPQKRLAGTLLVFPLVSVGLIAWWSGNPFNGTRVSRDLLRPGRRMEAWRHDGHRAVRRSHSPGDGRWLASGRGGFAVNTAQLRRNQW